MKLQQHLQLLNYKHTCRCEIKIKKLKSHFLANTNFLTYAHVRVLLNIFPSSINYALKKKENGNKLVAHLGDTTRAFGWCMNCHTLI
jgi:glycopeptide antibiotics resistance protein